MGGIMARAGYNNDNLTDVLLEENYIKTEMIEKVFRAVDRAEYFLPEARSNAYNGLAWKYWKLHLSAPCVYSTAMEGLCLGAGLSFLNLGSGTGYLSTMVGLILGSNGINHGIEFYSEVVEYANMKLEEFRKYSGALDEFDYCEPKFTQGNVLCLSSDFHGQYDRVYCGAAVPEQYESYMKNLLKIGGILVMPVNDKLLQVKRISETHWESDSLLPVSFATLIQATDTTQDLVQMFDVEPLSLQALCRALIRNTFRKNIELEHTKVKKSRRGLPIPEKKKTVKRLVVPLFESEDSSDDDRHVLLGLGPNRDGRAGILRDESDGLLNFVLGTFREGRNRLSGNSQQNHGADHSHDNHGYDHSHQNHEPKQSTSEDVRMETDTTESAGEPDNKKGKLASQTVQTQAVIEHNPSTSQNNGQNRSFAVNDTCDANEHQKLEEDNSLDSIEEIHNVFVDVLNVLRRNEVDTETNDEHEESDERRHMPDENRGRREKKKREKSRPADEIVEDHSDTSDDEHEQRKKRDAASSSDEDYREKRNKRGPKKTRGPVKALKCRRIELPESESKQDSSSENDEDDEIRMYNSPYTVYMKAKLQELPLPPILKKYLNFYRGY